MRCRVTPSCKYCGKAKCIGEGTHEVTVAVNKCRYWTTHYHMDMYDIDFSWANASFKAACVSDKWALWVQRAKAATNEVRRILKGCPPSGVLGRAILVDGVTTSVLARRLQDANMSYRAVVGNAIKLFYEAERTLVRALGPVNEHSL